MPTIANNKVLFQFRMLKTDKDRFEEQCTKRMINKSELIRRLIMEWTEKAEQEEQK